MRERHQSHFGKSFRDALSGLRIVYARESNFRVETAIAICMGLTAYILGFSYTSWTILLFLIVFILALEIVNTAIEHLVDLLKPRLHDQIKIIKDMMAGAVLVSSFGAVVIGTMLFAPFFIELLSSL